MTIVKLFDLREHFRIEIRTCADLLFYRAEIVDDGAFISFYTGDNKTVHPPTYFYTRAKGAFYYGAFRKDFQQSWRFAKEKFPMNVDTNQDELEDFLVSLGGADKTKIAVCIDEWRKNAMELI